MMPFLPFVPFVRMARSGSGDAVSRLKSPRPQDRRAALDEIYRLEAGAVYRYALALCGNADWAADATQEAFVGLALRPQGFDPAVGALGAYLAGAARHALASHWRRTRRESPLPDDNDDDGDAAADATATTALSPEALLVRTQDGHEVWAALRQLPMAFREAVVLVDLQERPYAEAAQIAGIPLNTLRTRLFRARARLAILLGAGPRSTP